jgi:16S rRNA G966 N2-methylase RsmD
METENERPTKSKPWSDIDLDHWRDYDHVLTDSLWIFPSRASGKGHSLDYHGNFIPQIATQAFTRYTKAGEVVLDLFLGSGTSAIEALNLGRRCIGVELKPDLIKHIGAKLPTDKLDTDVKLIRGDSTTQATADKVRMALKTMGENHAHLLILHPPYHDIVPFSDQPEDLSNASDTGAFLEMFETVARHGYDLLAPGRFAVLVIGDKYEKGELIPLGFRCMEHLNRVGFVTKAIVVKNIEGNERGKGRASNLWRYRALAGGYYIFKHEYVIVLRKPE